MSNKYTSEKQFSVWRIHSLGFILGAILLLCPLILSAEPKHLIHDEELSVVREEFYFDHNESGELSRYRITGTRYGDPNGEPWVLCHGFLQTEYSMLEYVKGLVAQGKNVFVINEVGFGLEGRRSLVRPGVSYQEGDYGFQGVVEGVAQAVANVSKITQKKVVLMGFSMGAMASREYIEGTYSENSDGEPIRDEKLAKWRQNKLKHVILIAGPPDNLTGMALLLKLAAAFGYTSVHTVAKSFQGFIKMGLGGSSEDLSEKSFASKAVRTLRKFGLFPIVRLLFRDGGDLRNYGSKEKIFHQILRYEFSDPHADIFRSFTKKSVNGNRPSPMQGSRGKMKITIVAGEKDGFVSTDSHLNEYVSYYQKKPELVRGIMVSGVGHLDLTGEVIVQDQELLNRLVLRVDEPQKYDQNYRNYEVMGKMNISMSLHLDSLKEKLRRKVQAPICQKVHAS